MTAEEQVAAIREALKKMSPSAPYELRRAAIDRTDAVNPEKKPMNALTGWRSRWWNDYPLGNVAAFIFRVAYILNDEHLPPWEVKGEELPR